MSQPKRIVITGITGQDGSYMAEYCLNLGHYVYGMVRRTSTINTKNFKSIMEHPRFKMVYGDLNDSASINGLVQSVEPDYFINFAAQSFVGISWQIPEETFSSGVGGVLKCLEAIRKYAPACRFYNAGSSEQFGDVVYSPQDEKHPFRPRSPYAAAKCAAYYAVKVYRESYNLYAVQGFLFNHESERRGEEFVTRKITKGIARILSCITNKQNFKPIELGNIDAKRDWSHAEDFIDGVWRMLNQDTFNTAIKDVTYAEQKKGGILLPFAVDKRNSEILSKHVKEYVLASGETHTVREFIEKAFKEAGIDGVWIKGNSPEDERFMLADYLCENWNVHNCCLVAINKNFYRPAEVDLLLGDSSLARKELDWKPKNSFDKLVKRMVSYDLYEAGILPQDAQSSQEK
jgi:GDPmannose 4,6-dehydratase